MIYLDNAATSWPKPESVYRAMDSFMRDKAANPGRAGHRMAVTAEAAVEEARTLVARLVGAPDPRDIVFTCNCTDSLNLALKGLLRPGDHIITDSIGHNSLVRPLHRLEQDGVRVTRLLPSEKGWLSAEDVERAITPETRAIAVTHGSNVSGVIQPLEDLGEVAWNHNIALIVDAAQTAAVLPIDVLAANVALLAFSGHKGPMGPTGIGALYISKSVDLLPMKEGGTGTVSESEEQPIERPQRYEAGTPNTVGIAGFGAGVKWVLAEGVENIRGREEALIERTLDGLRSLPGVSVYGPASASERIGAISFRIDGWTPGDAAAVLDQAFDIAVRSGLHCAPAAHKVLGTFPQGAVRASIGCFNTADEIDVFLKAVSKIACTKPALSARTA